MRTKKHYEKLLADNPNATVGFTLAAQAVYAAKHGDYPGPNESDGTDIKDWREIARDLKQKYGENLTVAEVRLEMSHITTPDKRIAIRYDFETWKKLRHLQEEGKIESFQEATERGIKLLIAELEKPCAP